MAFVELGMSEKEFYATPPRHTFMKQMHGRRKIERMWEQTRFLGAMQHNTAMGKKRNIRPQQLIKLSFDQRGQIEWTKEEAEDLIKKWGVN